MDLTKRADYFRAMLDAVISSMDFVRRRAAEPDRYVLLDVRIGDAERLAEKIPGAIMIPAPEIGARLDELPRDRRIVVYGWEIHCTLGAKAGAVLCENGFDAVELFGGLKAWKSHEFKTEALV